LREVKSVLGIDPNDPTEDKNLLFYIEWATKLATEIVGHEFDYKVRTEFYDGTGCQKLNLRHRPVYPTAAPATAAALPFTPLTVTYDSAGYYGASSGAFTSSSGTSVAYVYGADYTLRIDQTDGGSRSGQLIRINEYWTRPVVRQAGLLTPFIGDDTGSFQVIYTAGFTADTLPAFARMAVDMLVAAIRYQFLSAGMALSSESYEERHITLLNENRQTLVTPQVRTGLWTLRNWYWG
jgi:hypothetical protein